MPREEYDYLTDATEEVLTDNVKAVSLAWKKCHQYVYAILQNEKKDFFAPFLALYTACAKAGVSTAPYRRELDHVDQRYSGVKAEREASEAFNAKFKGNGQLLENYLAAISDGKLTIEELNDLEPLVETEMELIKVLQKAMAAHRVRLEARGNQ